MSCRGVERRRGVVATAIVVGRCLTPKKLAFAMALRTSFSYSGGGA